MDKSKSPCLKADIYSGLLDAQGTNLLKFLDIMKITKRHKDYKEYNFIQNMRVMSKRGQMAIFVIVAIVIVAAILIFFLYPGIRTNITGSEFTASSYLKDCIQPNVKESIDLLSKQGGYANPEGFIVYNDTKIKYLCYIEGYYKTCVIQQPMIKNHFESELNSLLAPKARACFTALEKEYEKRGYSVSSSSFDSKVELVPGQLKINFMAPITVTKESSNTYREFNVVLKSEMYDLLFTAASIIEFEATYGDSETTTYLQYYPNLKIEKTKLSDGSKIYRLTNVVTKETFTFASRSISWPPGYGLDQ